MRVWAKRLAIGLAVAAGGYLLAANLFLNTPLAGWAVNRRPERLRLTWSAAWSLWPGDLHVRGLEVSGRQRRVRWSIGVESGRARFDLPGLLRRQVRLAGVRAAGVRSRTVWRPAAAQPRRAAARRHPWQVTLEDVEIVRLREVRVGPLRLQGNGTAAGSFRLVTGREVRAELARLDLRGSTLRAGRATIARDARLRAELRLGPYAPRRHPGARGFDFLSGSLALAGTRPGRLDLRLVVRDGRLLPGSRALYRAPPSREIARLTVRAVARPAPGGARLLLHGGAAGVSVYRSGGAFESDALQIAATTPDPRLSRLFAAARGSLWGDLRGDGVRLVVTGGRTAWDLALPGASGRIDLPALLRRELRLAGLRAPEAALQLRAAAPPAARRGPPRRRWSVRVADSRLAGRAEIALRDLTLAGDLEAAGGFAWKGGRLAVAPTALALQAGRIRRGEETLARDLALRGEARLDPFVPGSLPGVLALRPLSAGAEVSGWLASLGFLDPYLRKAPWLDLRGDGPFTATLRLDHGRLAAGSALRVAPARVVAEYLTSRARGSATVTGAVKPRGADGAALDLEILFGRFEIATRQPPDAPPHLRGRGLRLDLTTDDLDLTHAERDVRLRVHLPAAEAPDLTAFNGYLPAGAGVAFLGGSGRLRSELELETRGNSGRGTLALTSNDMRVRFYDLGIAGALDLDARLVVADLSQDRFRLDGTRLVLERVTWSELDGGAPAVSGPSPDGWWAHLDFTRGTARWARPLTLESTVAARMKDAGLLLALFARRRRAVGWLQGVLDEERLAARAELRLTEGAIELDPLRVTSERLDLRTRLRLTPERKRGYLFVRYGRLATAIELEDERRTYHLRRPLEWYESRKGLR